MRKLLRRARRVYHNEGFVPTVRKSARFVPRYIRHVLGVKALYGSSYYRNLLYWWNSRSYSTVADPFKIIYIDPDRIRHITGRGPNPGRFQWQDIGKVQAGNWDQNNERIDDLPVVQALYDRFEEGKDWENIDFIQHVLEQAEHGHVIWRGCMSDKDVWEACAQVDHLYERIQDQGYRSKQELVQQEERSPDKYADGDQFNCYDEVVVDIGRDGEILFVDGRHRLAMAKILKLEEIPVRISTRHERWQRIRKLAATIDESEKLPETVAKHRYHPDLKDVLGDGNEKS